MCEWGTTVVVATPAWLWDRRAIPENGIHIDSCIADVVTALWDRDIYTLSSCCGHGKMRPSLVLDNASDIPLHARAALAEIDPDRDWELLQWQLTDVSEGS